MTTAQKAPRNRGMSDKQGEQFAQHIKVKATRPEGGTSTPVSHQEQIAAIDAEIANLNLLSHEANEKLRVAEEASDEPGATKLRALLHGLHEQREVLSKSRPTRWNRFKGWVKRQVDKVVGVAKPVVKAPVNVLAAIGEGIARAVRWVVAVVGYVVATIVHVAMFLLALVLMVLAYLAMLLLRVVQFLALLLAWPKYAVERRAKSEFGVFFASLAWNRMGYLDYRQVYTPPAEPTHPRRRTSDLVDPKARRRRPVRPPVVVSVAV